MIATEIETDNGIVRKTVTEAETGEKYDEDNDSAMQAVEMSLDGEQQTRQLLTLAQAGDKSAFEAIYAELAPDIQRYVRRLINSPQAVEDIVQDTFISLYLNLDSVKSGSHLRPYVYRIARNNCYDLLREWGRREHVSVDEDSTRHEHLMFELSHTQHSPEDAAHWMLMLVEVQSLMDALPDNQRETLILYSEEGMTYAEIAEVMEVNIGTVKSRLFHAKRTLRRMVNPDVLLALQNPAVTPDQEDLETANTSKTAIDSEGDNNG